MINHLGLAYKAKKVKLGVDHMVTFMQKKQARLVLIASDASDLTKKKVTDKTKYYGIDLCESYDCNELSSSIGKSNIKVITIIDDGFARLIKSNKGCDENAKK